MAFLLDTTFIIDLERESRIKNKHVTGASLFLKDHPNDEYNISMVTMGELTPGFDQTSKDQYLHYPRLFQILPLDIEVSWLYGQIFNDLRKNGLTIGSNDLWIGATALRFNKSILTRNVKDFRNILNLEVVAY